MFRAAEGGTAIFMTAGDFGVPLAFRVTECCDELQVGDTLTFAVMDRDGAAYLTRIISAESLVDGCFELELTEAEALLLPPKLYRWTLTLSRDKQLVNTIKGPCIFEVMEA